MFLLFFNIFLVFSKENWWIFLFKAFFVFLLFKLKTSTHASRRFTKTRSFQRSFDSSLFGEFGGCVIFLVELIYMGEENFGIHEWAQGSCVKIFKWLIDVLKSKEHSIAEAFEVLFKLQIYLHGTCANNPKLLCSQISLAVRFSNLFLSLNVCYLILSVSQFFVFNLRTRFFIYSVS